MRYGRLDRNIFIKVKEDLKNQGLKFTITKTGRYFYHKILPHFANYIIKSKQKHPKFFTYNNDPYPYMVHEYNLTWINERTVEVPIILRLLKDNLLNDKEILEVGSVLKNYTEHNNEWDIVDRFEESLDVINQDIMDFNPNKNYDLILSISTFEHIGYDDEDSPHKAFATIDKCRSMLTPKGRLIFTIPLGYNQFLDNYVFELETERVKYMKRLNEENQWIQATRDEVVNIKYNQPYNNANAIAIVYLTK